MNTKIKAVVATGVTMFYGAAAWAGSGAGGGGPAGAEGGGGSEPTMIALILLSIVPAVYFARKAMAVQPVRVDD